MKKLLWFALLVFTARAFAQSTFSGGGTISSTGVITAGHCASFVNATLVQDSGAACGGGGAPAFSVITSGTNTTAAMIVGTGASLSSVPEFDIGGVGTNGILGLLGTTSGKATFTAPAIAGTVSNPVISSNGLALPDGTCTTPAYGFSGSSNVGMTRTSGDNGAVLCASGSAIASATASVGFVILGTGPLAFSASASTAAKDTELSRLSAGVLSTDNGTQGSGLGSLSNCRIVVNVTPVTVNANVATDQNLMAATIPANCLSTVNRTMRIWIAGVYSTPAASTSAITLKVKLCSVSGCGSGNVATLINIVSTAIATLQVTNNAFNSSAWSTTQTAGAASRSEAHGIFAIDLGASNATADSVFNDTNTATVAGSPADIDFTAQNFLQITIAASVASASNSFTERQLIVDSIL